MNNLKKQCKICKKTFEKSKDYSVRSWGKAVYCSIHCRHEGTRSQRIPKEKVVKARSLLIEGIAVRKVGTVVGLSHNTVRLYGNDILLKRKRNIEERNKEMVAMYIAGVSRKDIGKSLGVTRGTISVVCKGLRKRTLKGEKNPAWRGGVTKLQDIIRKSNKYQDWRKAVFVRDNYTCQITHEGSNKLVVDHIKPFALILKEHNIDSLEKAYECEELWDINNGRTLKDCVHKNTDTYGWMTYNLIRKATN